MDQPALVGSAVRCGAPGGTFYATFPAPAPRNCWRAVFGDFTHLPDCGYAAENSTRRFWATKRFDPESVAFLPAVIFLVAMLGYRRHRYLSDSAFDRSIYMAVWLNLAAQLAACQSVRLLDGPFVFAQGLNVGQLLYSAGRSVIGQCARLRAGPTPGGERSPDWTGQLSQALDVLDTETERTLRTGRPFAVLLLDLDGLKKINDSYGHLVGSRALCRVADILRFHCRAIDTAARYGGDEFAVVLPEAREEEAQRVASRIRETLVSDEEFPPISASIGASVYHGEGERVEKLLKEADQNLYDEKRGGSDIKSG